MNPVHQATRKSRQSILFRVFTFAARMQLHSGLRHTRRPRLLAALFAMLTCAIALGTITLAAVWSKLPLLFPPLAPSAFILFNTPMASTAAPRNVILSHTGAVIIGMASLHLVAYFMPHAGLLDPAIMNWERVLVMMITMAAVTSLMVGLKCSHPPAAASALIAAMGYFEDPMRALGLICASILLAGEAIVINRLVGGLPYPLWRPNNQRAREFGALAGLGDHDHGFWLLLSRNGTESSTNNYPVDK